MAYRTLTFIAVVFYRPDESSASGAFSVSSDLKLLAFGLLDAYGFPKGFTCNDF